MLAYKNDPDLRSKLMREMRKHVRLDMLHQGATGGDNKGCTVACAMHSLTGEWDYDHARLSEMIGVPEHLLRLADSIFEGLPTGEAKEFSQAWPKAIKVGANLSLVWPKVAVWLLIDQEHGVIRNVGSDAKVREAIERVAALWQRVIAGEPVESLKAEFTAAESAARSAVESAARSAVWSAAESAARSAAESAARSAVESAARSAVESAARSAVWSAVWSAAESAARSAHWKAIAAKLLSELAAAK